MQNKLTLTVPAGVQPILMAGGATLSIVDPGKAKGLVYFSASDRPVKWSNAKDAGLYFGGAAEGPYAAIAKSGAGKAAFIGDSSPIEDATPKYRREDNGNSKKTYLGWTDSGNAATLAVNIVNWLATPETYHRFDGTNGHVSGVATPQPMASTEMTAPNNGQPWGTPANGYNAWNTDTFKNNAYNAPYGTTNTEPDPNPTPGGTVSVATALNAGTGTPLVILGKVTAAVNDIYGLQLTDTNNSALHLNVKLESTQRNDFSPTLNPDMLKKNVIVTGKRDSYMGAAGVKYVTDIQLAPTSLSVEQALASAQGSAIELTGRVKAALNDIDGLVLEDNNNLGFTINIKLEASQRAGFSPQLNQGILGAQLLIKGVRDSYMSKLGVRQVSAIEDISNADVPDQHGDSSVTDVLALANGAPVVVAGVIHAAINGQYALELADSQNAGDTLYVKLETNQRDAFSPALNSWLIGKRIRVEGIKNDYLSHAGVRSVSKLTLLTNELLWCQLATSISFGLFACRHVDMRHSASPDKAH